MIDGVQARLEDYGRRIQRLEDTEPAVTANEVKGLAQDVHEVRDEMRALKRALYGLAFSIAGGAVLFAFTAFQIWGGNP